MTAPRARDPQAAIEALSAALKVLKGLPPLPEAEVAPPLRRTRRKKP